ncbi:hypothetical protein F3K30_40855 [Streptomyces sp. LBUM 1487]|nr:hypothetical protein [Streptomyces sp. LBUM 1487]
MRGRAAPGRVRDGLDRADRRRRPRVPAAEPLRRHGADRQLRLPPGMALRPAQHGLDRHRPDRTRPPPAPGHRDPTGTRPRGAVTVSCVQGSG